MEPSNLRRGKAFQKKVQSEWSRALKDGTLTFEQVIHPSKSPGKLISHRKGRLDVFMDELGNVVSVIEIRSTNWNSVKPGNVGRVLAAHQKRVWESIGLSLAGLPAGVRPGLIYPFPPRDGALRVRIEEYLSGHGIQAMWFKGQ